MGMKTAVIRWNDRCFDILTEGELEKFGGYLKGEGFCLKLFSKI